MKKLVFLTIVCFMLLANGQPFTWPAEYAATSKQGGTIQVSYFGDVSTFSPLFISSSQEVGLIGNFIRGPEIIYRDWLGSRSFKTDGEWNMFWAKNIEEIALEQEYVVTLREGWQWSDGDAMDVDDVIAAYTLMGDEKVESDHFQCAHVGDKPISVVKLSQYQYRITLPRPVVNALSLKSCAPIPAHIFMPVYEASGAEGVKALWNVSADVTEIISGGPYVITEFNPDERLVFEPNPFYSEVVKAADGSPIPGPERMVVSMLEDKNAQLSRVLTGQSDYLYPSTLDDLAAIQDAIDRGAISGVLYANIGPATSLDFITYNFNNTDVCKVTMFRDVIFRRAMSMLIDRQALVDTALGGLGIPSKDLNTSAAAPFDAPFLDDFEFNPDEGVALLQSIGFTTYGNDNVLTNPDTGCRVDFDLQFNSGNSRRKQEAALIAQTARPFGVKINVKEVPLEVWLKSIRGDFDYDETGVRTIDYDAEIWGLSTGDFDNPSWNNVFTLQANLNSWNKSRVNIEAWEILLDRLTNQMDETLNLEDRVVVYNQRAEVMREYLPITPLISPNFHLYTNLGNMWPADKFNANSIARPYRPGNFPSLLQTR